MLFQLLNDYIGMRYIDAALDSALEDLSVMDPKFPPDMRPMKRVKLVSGIVHLLQMHFQTTIVSLFSHFFWSSSHPHAFSKSKVFWYLR